MNTVMPGFLASVSNLEEARLVAGQGVDIVDLKNPGAGALGAVAPAELRRIVAALRGRHMISATIGDRPLVATDDIRQAVSQTAALGVDIVKVGWFGECLDNEVMAALRQLAGQQINIVVVLFAEQGLQLDYLPHFAAAGLYGVMLDTADKQSGRLRDKLSDTALGSFVQRARESGLRCGLAGSLRREDIPPLCTLAPDYLGFRGALCRDSERSAALDESAVEAVRLMINADTHAQSASPDTVCA